MKLNYSLILPTCNRVELVKDFLQSVEKQTVLPREVIVIDQSDGQETRGAFEGWNPKGVDKKYIYQKKKSLILARNRGLDACGQTDLVVFFDDDVLLDSRYCEELIQVFENDHQFCFAGGMGAIQGWGYKFKPFQAFFLMPHEGSGCFQGSGAPTFPHWKKEFSETEFLSGGCTFWRRAIIQKYRFDERLSGYGHGDDIDISFRISRRYKFFFQPKAVCFQRENPPGRDMGCQYRRAWIQNMYYLVQKNRILLPAYLWCVVGHFLRDLICLDWGRLCGDVQGTWNVLRGQIDTIEGYEEFKRMKKVKW